MGHASPVLQPLALLLPATLSVAEGYAAIPATGGHANPPEQLGGPAARRHRSRRCPPCCCPPPSVLSTPRPADEPPHPTARVAMPSRGPVDWSVDDVQVRLAGCGLVPPVLGVSPTRTAMLRGPVHSRCPEGSPTLALQALNNMAPSSNAASNKKNALAPLSAHLPPPTRQRPPPGMRPCLCRSGC